MRTRSIALLCFGSAGILAVELTGCAAAPPSSSAPEVSAVSVQPEITVPSCASDDAGACGSDAPRAIAPLSSSTVTSQTPIFHWQLPAGATGAQVDICRDRACANVVASFAATGTSGAPASALAKGVYYWRLHAKSGAAVDPLTSPAWQFFVGPRSATSANTSSGSVLDANGDGIADVVLGAESGSRAGTVSLYLGGASGLAQSAAATFTGPGGEGSTFGDSVASAGDVNGDGFADLIVGAKRDPNANGAEVGAAYLYFGSASGFGASPAVKLQGQGGYFGASVASAGDVNGDGYADVIVGAPNDASAYVFLGGPSLSATLYLASAQTLTGAAGSSFGSSVAGIGDLNGDGLGDVAIGAPEAANGAGAASVYLGSALGVTPFTLPLLTAGGELGASVAPAGDVNGDGYSDLVIGAPASGIAYVYQGGPTAPATGDVAAPVATVGIGRDNFGASVASAGDVNGDGFADVIVAATEDRTAYVYAGSASGVSTTVLASVATPGAAGATSAANVAGVGDVNGDGFADVIVEASGWGSDSAGEADLHLGGAEGIATSAAATVVGEGNEELGSAAY